MPRLVGDMEKVAYKLDAKFGWIKYDIIINGIQCPVSEEEKKLLRDCWGWFIWELSDIEKGN